jgi:hypothetical protein
MLHMKPQYNIDKSSLYTGPETTKSKYKNDKIFDSLSFLQKSKKFTEVISYNDKNKGSLYKTTVKYLMKQNIQNWSLNRPVDTTRIPEIANDMIQSKQVFGIIYLVYNDSKEVLECYDGIHRIGSLKYLYNNPSYKQEIKHIKVLVDITPIYNEGYIIHKFKTINKCIPIPDIFTCADKKLELQNKIIMITENFVKKYPQMFKTSNRPNIPHENRDRFIDKLTDIINELKLEDISLHKMIELFESYNIYIKENLQKRLTNHQKEKCSLNNMYIFWNKHWNTYFVKEFQNGNIKLQ